MEIKEVDKMNLKNYKEGYENYQKMKRKLVRALDTQVLIDELKRRKIIHINWETMKYDKTDRSSKASCGVKE